MKKFIALLALTLAAALLVAALPGQHGQGKHQQQTQARSQEQQQTGKRARLHDCQNACNLARQEARQLQRYADRSRFDTDTARQLGRQLHEHLAVMDREHSRLRERLSAQEQEQHRERLQTMDRCQQHWQAALGNVDQELHRDAPNPEQLRREARTIEKEIKNYQTELNRLQESVGG